MGDRQAVQRARLVPRASAWSARAAWSSAAPKVRVTTALTAPSTSSIRWMWAAVTSRADTSRRRIIPASVTASIAHRSVTRCSLGLGEGTIMAGGQVHLMAGERPPHGGRPGSIPV